MHDLNTSEEKIAALSAAPSIAIIGMSGRFPESASLAEYWDNLIAGRECVSHFSTEELVEAGMDPMAVSNPKYIRSKGVLGDALCFDAGLFGFSPREAEIIDPQQRVFLECSMAALEDAGCDPDRFDGSIGIYGGQSMSSYIFSLLLDPRNSGLDSHQVSIGNDKDFLTSRTSYKLNLKGPSVVVQSACSTSLVALCLAYQSLLDYQCDIALAGGVCITFPQKDGYIYEDGGTYSPDGRCRAFDAQNSGLVGGNGVGIVVLKRLDDALADRDHIHAVIRGAAINNDGSVKIGYTAPSVDGQAEAISTAHALGDIDPETVTYVEAHGTGTRLGDPIEVAALTKAFRRKTSKAGYCGIGSVKTNIGHLDAAAGVAGLIKTVLAMQHQQLPPSLHVQKLNPQIDFESSPFYVCTKAAPWPDSAFPRRAGVSSFGIGGTNAHVVVEEAPAAAPSEAPERDLAVLTLSGNSGTSLKRVAAQMADYLRCNPAVDIADVAYSLQVGRKAWKHRLSVVCRNATEAADLIDGVPGPSVARNQADATTASVVFLFPGQGAQHVGMMRGLYEHEPSVRATLDECAELLQPVIGIDLRALLFAADSDTEAAAQLDQTHLTQPALFVVEYALAKLWMSWGVQPSGMLGHSIGEYVAACLAGVIDLPDALRLVSRRGELMQSLPAGDMASVPLPDHEVIPLLTDGLSLAAVLGPKLCVVSGNHSEVEALRVRLAEHGVEIRAIRTSHAFHSKDMEPILDDFAAAFKTVKLRAPKIPFISNLTGTWITAAEAVDPAYWVRQLRNMVRLQDGLAELTRPAGTVCIEVGPGRGLSALSQQAVEGRKINVVASCRDRHEPVEDVATLVGAVGRLWGMGGQVDWRAFSGGDSRRKIPLPTYPFEREEYSLLHEGRDVGGPGQGEMGGERPASDTLFAPVWRRAAMSPSASIAGKPDAVWLVFLDSLGLGTRCVARLKALQLDVITVGLDTGTDLHTDADYRLSADKPAAYKQLFDTLSARGKTPDRILHLWNIGPTEQSASQLERVRASRVLGFDSLLYLMQAIGSQEAHTQPCLITVGSTGLYDVTGGEEIEAEKALLVGPCRVIPTEQPHLGCKSVDLALEDIAAGKDRDVDALLVEASQPGPGDVALRRGQRWVRGFEAMYFSPHGDPHPELPSRLRQNGTYLITGGLGGIGLEIAGHLARRVGARLILTGRTLPPIDAYVAAIEAAGGEVMQAQVDVTDRAGMASVIKQAVERFGPIHGVIHAAGVPGRGIMQLKTQADVDRVLAPKVDGLLILDELFADADLDFLVACSSIATVVGAPGQAEYTSANAFLDAFVNARREGRTRLLSINWDRWAEVGMAVKEMANQPGQAEMPPWMVQGLKSAEAVEGFELALDSAETQIAVALGNFEWISRYGPPRQAPVQKGPDAGTQRGYRRPDIETVFEAPTNDLEIGIAGLFHEVLGIKEVGIDDNFFDLGGHSLLGVRLVNRIQEAFFVEIGIGELFSLPSVRSLSQTIAARASKSSGTAGRLPAIASSA